MYVADSLMPCTNSTSTYPLQVFEKANDLINEDKEINVPKLMQQNLKLCKRI